MRKQPSVYNRSCPNPDCEQYGQLRKRNIIKYGYFKLKRGKRRRYLCQACGKTFCSTTSTPYHRIQHSKNLFDEVCLLSVEGVNKSTIARVKRISWNTVFRWIERACVAAKRFNQMKLKDISLLEPQADEIRTFISSKKQPIWVITLIEVWSRLWISCVVGKRNYKNIRRLFRDTLSKSDHSVFSFITTDGFKLYDRVISRLFGHSCVYGQVVKTRRKDKVVRVERKLIIGTKQKLEEMLERSEDSSTPNTPFIERHNLTIRRGSPCLQRRTPAHARIAEYLNDHLELQQCYYNFIRPHSALKYGNEIWTPAMQAGLASKQMTFRQVFLALSRSAIFMFVYCLSVSASSKYHRKVA